MQTNDRPRPDVPDDIEPVATVLLVEVAGYIGAAAGVTGALLLLARTGASNDATVLLTSLALTAALVVAGAFIGRRDVDAYARLRSVLWFAAVFTWSAAIQSLLADAELAPSSTASVLVSAALAALAAVALWWPLRRSLQAIAVFLGATALVAALLDVAGGPGGVGPVVQAVIFWAFGVGWAWLGVRGVMAPRVTTVVVGTITALGAPAAALSGSSPTVGPVSFVAFWIFATAVAALWLGARYRLRAAQGLGIVGIIASTLVVVLANLADSQGDAVIALVIGIAGVAVAGALARSPRSSPPATAAIPPAPPASF
jgi:hypothetical protein